MSADPSTLDGLHIERERLADALAGLGDPDPADGGQPVEIHEALSRVVNAVEAVFRVAGAGLMLIDGSSVLRYVVASDGPGRLLETAQEAAGTGPCVEALVLDHIVVTADLADDERWPEVAKIVVPEGVRAVLGVPVRVGGGPVGSLNVYTDEPHDWDDSEIDAIGRFGTVIEDVLSAGVLMRRSSELVDQLQYALDHRVEIERAVGLTMGTDRVDAVTAFNLLRSRARSQRIKVADVARAVLEGHAPGSDHHAPG